MAKQPRVSIGIPAYNAEATIGYTLEALLAQTYGDHEIIVSDNASTDATREIVEEYRKRDTRIKVVQHPVNIGANPNYSHVVRCASGNYFKWSSSSDWCAPTFLERCVTVLENNEDTVLAAPRTRLFQDHPDSSTDYAFDVEILDDSPAARFERLAATMALNNAMNGLIRLSALRRTPLIEPYHSADIVLMGYLALQGKFRLVNEYLFYRRMEAATATALKDPAEVRKHHYPQRSARTLFQGSKRQLGWLRAALSVPLPLRERRRVIAFVAKIWYWERGLFLDDLREAWKYVFMEPKSTNTK